MNFLFTGTSRPITSSLQYPLPLLPLKNYIFTCMKHPPWKISNKSSMLSIAPKLLQHKSSQLYYEFNLPLKTSAFNYLMLSKKIHSNDWINLATAYPVRYIYIYIQYCLQLDIALWHTKLYFHVQIEHSTRMSHYC